MATADAFIGIETSNGPAKGFLTLFVPGRWQRTEVVEAIDSAQELEAVRALKLHLKHLHFGIKSSFDGIEIGLWADTIKYFLREGFWCSLSVKANQLPLVQKMSLSRHARFVLVVNMHMPESVVHSNTVLRFGPADEPQAWSIPLTRVTLTNWRDLDPIHSIPIRIKVHDETEAAVLAKR